MKNRVLEEEVVKFRASHDRQAVCWGCQAAAANQQPQAGAPAASREHLLVVVWCHLRPDTETPSQILGSF